MNVQVYSIPGQTERKRKAFLEWKSIDLSYELSLTYGDSYYKSVNYYKSVHHPILTLLSTKYLGIFSSWLN